MRLLRPLLAPLLVACAACASDPIDTHPANPEIQRQIATIIQGVRTASGAQLYANLQRLIAYDVFAVDQLLPLARDESARLRSNAFFVLAQIRDAEHPARMERIEDALRDGLDDPDPTVRYEAATGLAGRGEWDVLPVLIDGLDHADPGVRYRCHQQLLATTSQDFGYSIDADGAQRQAAVAHWRAWYEKWEQEHG
jgi:hypothetical protein